MTEIGITGWRKVCQPFLFSNLAGIENSIFYFVPNFQILPAPSGVFFMIFEKIFEIFWKSGLFFTQINWTRAIFYAK
ncbi:MAG: hypothetical protein IKS45_05775 [Thermoguttaceae bacterium]|nr:hypothetical protein [Thermoguttaceae bacterium]